METMNLNGQEIKEESGRLALADGLWGVTDLDTQPSAATRSRAELLKKSYLLLSASVVSAIAGGAIGVHSTMLVYFFSGWFGWIVAMVALNAIPYVALAARHDPVRGVAALVADGFVSGIVLSPLLYVATLVSPNLIPTAMLLTLVVFCSVTGYVLTARRVFSAPRALIVGIFFSIIGAIVLNGFLHLGALGFLIAFAIGALGVLTLVYATSDVLHSSELDTPIAGALMLFAGVFNVFVAALNILLQVAGGSEDQ